MPKTVKTPCRVKAVRLPEFGESNGVPPIELDWDLLNSVSVENYKPPKPDLAGWRRCTSKEHIGVRASLFQGRPRQPAALIKLLKGDGQPELVGPIEEALVAMHVWQKSGPKERLEKIPVHRVLSIIWANYKLVHNFQTHFEKKTAPPPIRVSEIHLLGKIFYELEDGNHRNEAAKMLGHKTICAEIAGTTTVELKQWRIVPGGLENQTTGETRPRDADVLAAAAWLGVKSKKAAKTPPPSKTTLTSRR